MTTHLRALTRSSLTFCLLVVAVIAVNLLLSVISAAHTPSSLFQPSTAYAAQSRYRTDLPSSIVFVHGFNFNAPHGNGASKGWDCLKLGQDGYWGDAKSFLGKMLPGEDFRTIKYYQGDVNCNNGNERAHSADLHAKAYRDHCLHYQSGGEEGTNNESIYHLSCLFAWYLHDNFGNQTPQKSEIVIAHSMGGLILREAIYQVQNRVSLHTGNTFPSTIGHITEAITLNTPHMGWDQKTGQQTGLHFLTASIACGRCQQITDMNTFSRFMTELLTKGQDPQAGGTEWTLIGSDCDPLVGAGAVDMDGANHVVLYIPPSEAGASGYPGITVCYDHGGALHDQDRNLNAAVIFCDTQDVARRSCYNKANRQMLRYTAPHALQAIYEVITNPGHPPYSQVGGPDGPTCTTGANKRCT